jgi:E3 ubiquitin-protein ligase DOA10
MAANPQISTQICGICHSGPMSGPHEGPLLSLCNCKGSIQLIDVSCHIGRYYCELCGFRFLVRRLPLSSFFKWVKSEDTTNKVSNSVQERLIYLATQTFSQRTTHLFGNCRSVKEPLIYLATAVQSKNHSAIWQLNHSFNESVT